MTPLTLGLRDYQQAAIETFRALPEPKRYFLAWDMGAGKTLGALAIAQATARKRILIICPAMVRSVWLKEARKLYGERIAVGVHTCGNRTSLSRARAIERERAHLAPIQITSYDLIGHVSADGWDLIIVDEFHNLRSCTSKQSKLVRNLFRANPQAYALGLSGTPIPNEAKQLWNPVDIFFPRRWGLQSRPGYEPYSFVRRYCLQDKSDYGTRFYGLQAERKEELAARFREISSRVVQADFARYLPPLFVEQLEIPAKRDPLALASQWLSELPSEAEHAGIYCHRRDTAATIAQSIEGAYLVTGEASASTRDCLLDSARQKPRSIVCGTTHSLREGISLSFQKAALILEWTSDLASVVQFLGRFARQDSASMAPTRVQVAVGPNDVSAAEVLSRRIEDINAIICSSRSMERAQNAFTVAPMSDDAFAAELEALARATEKRAGLWSAGEDEDDGDEKFL